MKANNWKKTFNIVVSGLSCMVIAVMLAINLINPIPTVKANQTKEDILKSNINFVAATTDIRQITGFTSSKQTKNGVDYYDYIYDYKVENFNYYTATSALPDSSETNSSGKLENDPMVMLTDLYTDSSKVEIEVEKGDDETDVMSMYAMYDYSSTDSTNNDYNKYYHYGYIPTDVQYFKDAKGTLQDVFYNEVGDNAFVLLQNNDIDLDSTSEIDPINISNFYLNFGSAIIDETNPHTALTDLRVSGFLYNSDGKKTLDINNTLSTNLTIGNAHQTNRYWYQYFDLNSIRVKTTMDSSSEVETITNTQGKYVFTFEYTTINADGSAGSTQNKYVYTFYLLDESTYASYPELTEDAILGSISADTVSSYFYNFAGSNYPEIEYYPNIYSISVERNYDGKTTNIRSNFTTNSIIYDGKTYNKALISYYEVSDPEGNPSPTDKLAQEVTILSYNKTVQVNANTTKHYSYYLYLNNTTGTSIVANSFNDYESYVRQGILDILFRVVDTIEVTTHTNNTATSEKTYTLYKYQTFKNYVIKNFSGSNFSNWYTTLDTESKNEKIIKEHYYLNSLTYNIDLQDPDAVAIGANNTAINEDPATPEDEPVQNIPTYQLKFFELDDTTINAIKATTTSEELLTVFETYSSVENNVLLYLTSLNNLEYHCEKISISSSKIQELLSLGTIQTNYYYSYNIDELGSYTVTYYYLVGHSNEDSSNVDYLSSKGSTITVKNYNVDYNPAGDGEEKIEVDKSENIDYLSIATTNGYSLIERVLVNKAENKVYVRNTEESSGSTDIFAFVIDRNNYSNYRFNSITTGSFAYNEGSSILYCVASKQPDVDKDFEPVLYRYNTITNSFDVVLEFPDNATLGAMTQEVVYYDVNTADNVYSVIRYFGSSHNDLRINFNKLGTTNYSNSLDIKTDKLAWNYDIDIDTSTKTVTVDADKDIIVFKISKGNEASKLHRYDSTATNNEHILLNNDTHYNYIVALNNNNEPCLYRIISNSVSDTPIINFTSRNTDTYIDKISLDQSELVIITYAYDSTSERLDIVFKVCKSNLIELSNNDRIGKVNALDISRISIAKDTSSTGKLSINDYYMDIFILNVSPTATNLVATSGHYYTGDFNNSALSFNASTQTAYAILCDAVTKNPGIFRYNHATRSWINLNIPMTETNEQMFIDSFTLNEDNISIALYYTYDATNNKFTNLSFSKLNYHDTTANVMTLEKGLEPSDTSVNAGFKQVSNDNLSIRYYSINNLLQGNAQYSPIYFVKAPNGSLTRYDNTADFATRFDSINALYTMSRDKVVENYTLNKYVIDKSVNNNGTDDDETDDIISYTTGSFSANIDFSGSTYETLYYHFPDGDDSTPDNLTYDQFISRLFSYTIAHLSGLDANHKPYIYSSVGGLFTIRGFSGSLTPNIYLVKRADNPTTLYVYNGSELNATYNETDEIYILSSSTRYDVKLLQYEFDFGVSNAISLIATPITSGDLYDAAYALTTAEDREMLPTTAVVANNNPFSTSIFDQNYYLNYIPSNGKVTALIINKKDNTKRFFDAEPFLNNVPFSLTDNLLFIFTTEMFSYKVWYYYENHGLLTASQLTLGKNQTNKIERLNDAYIKYTVGNNYYDIEFNVYITTNSSTDFASTQNISTNYLASQTMVTLNNQNKFTMPEYSVLLVGINTLSNELVNKITTFADNVEFDIDNNYYYLVAGNPTKTELYIYKLTYNTTNSNFEWAEVGFFNTSADSGIIDDTAFYQKISYNLDVNDKIRTIRFTAYANKSDTTSLTTYYKVFYNANDLDVSKTEIIHNKSGYYNINTTAHTLTTNEIYSARFLVLTYNDGVLNNVKVNTITKGELSLAPNQKLYVILNTTTGTDIYPALFTIDFSTSITTSLRYVNITTEPVSHTIQLELADDELYFEDNGLFIIYKFTTADSIQVNFVDMDTSHTTYTNFENKDFNPKNETVTPKITISDGVVSLESPSPLSFVVIDKKEYKTTEIFEMSNGSFEYNSVTQILYTFRIEAYTPEGSDEPIDILNLYRYDFSSPDVNFPFKKVATLDIDTTVTDVTTVEEEDYYEYCDIDYYEDIYTIVKYVCTADFKLVISFAKLYPAFVNIGGYFSGVGNEAQIVEIIGIPYSYSNNNNGQYSLIIRPGSLAEVVNLNFTTRVGVKPIVYTVDDVEYTTYVTYSLSLDTTGLYLNVKYVLGYMEIYEGTKQSISHVGSGSGENTNPEYGSITEKVTYQKIHQPIPSDTNIEEFNNLIRYVGTDLSSTQDNLIKYYTSETTSPIESSVNIDIFGLKNYYNLPNAETDNGYAEMKYNDVNEGIEYISDVTKVYINANENYDNNTYNNDTPISPDFLSELLGEGQITKNEDGLITAKTADIDPNAPFSLNNLIITNVTPTFWTYLCNFLYDSSNKISQSLIYKYDYDLVYDEWGTLKQLSYDSSEYTTYYLTKDTEINDDGLYQIIVKYTYNKYKYLDENTNVIDGENVVFYQLFTFIVNNNTPTLTISVGDDTNGYNLIGTSNYTNKGVKISWVATTEFQNYEYISITNSNFDGTVNFVSTYNPIDMEISTVGNSDMANSITKFSYDEDLKSYVVTINDSEAFSTNGAYKVRLHYGVNQSSYSTYSFNIDTEQITGLRLYEASMDENNLYYATKELRESNTPIQIVNQPFTLAFNQKSSGAKIYALYYKLTLNQSNDYSQLLNTIIGTQDYTTVTTNFIADGTLNTTNQSFIYNYKYNVEGVGDYISSQCYINPSKPTIYMFYLYDNAGNSCRYFVFYDITTPKYIISPELKNGYNIINDATSITWGDYKAIKIKTPSGFSVDLTDYTTNSYSDLSNYTILQSILMYINSNTANFKGTLVKVINGEYYLLVPLGDKLIENDNTNIDYTIEAGLINTSKFYLFTSAPTYLYVDINTGEVVLDVTDKLLDVDYKIVNSPTVTHIGESSSTYITVTYTYKSIEHTLYGTYGEYKYYFTISDVLGNTLTNFMWMNFDQTQGFAWASFSTAVSMDDIHFISPDNTYSAAQLYFSVIESNASNNIPEFKVSYNFYDFEYKNNDLYSNYTLVDASLETKDVTERNRATVTYLNLVYAKNDNIENRLNYSIEISYTDKDGNSHPIATTSYPFSLTSTTSSSDLFNESLSNYPSEDKDRIYSEMINPVYNTTTGTSMTAEGLYIFKREYTNIADASVLDNDSVIKYYVYYVDRTGIINLSSTVSENSLLHNMINFQLGSGQDESYVTDITSVNISSNSTNISTSKNSNNVEISSNLFNANKVPIKLNIPVDKYNFSTLYEKLTSMGGSYNAFSQSVKDVLNSTIYNSNVINKNFTLNVEYMLGNTPLDTTLTYQGGEYTLNISDNAGFDYTDLYGNLIPNYLSNTSTISYTITHSVPTASAYGKFYGEYDYIDTDHPDEFTLLTNYFANGNLKQLGLDSKGDVKEVNSSLHGSEVLLYNTNNESLVFIFSITNDKYKAQIDPNNLSIQGPGGESLILVNGGNVYAKNNRRNAFLGPTKINGVTYYAVVVYDNSLEDTKFEEYRLLDNQDNLNNSYYKLTVQYVGNSSYYVGSSSSDTTSSFHSTTYTINIDREIPTYNLTKLMANDKYYNDTIADEPVTEGNHKDLYKDYFKNYNPVLHKDYNYTTSDLNHYFFAVDYREDTSFIFESINSSDSSKNLYFRYLGNSYPTSYHHSITPDIYNVYHDKNQNSDSAIARNNPRFLKSDAISASAGNCRDTSKYYSLSYTGVYNNVTCNNEISLFNLTNAAVGYDPIMYPGGYYEIIEADEADNYQVYGIYLPKYSDVSITYSYNPTESTEFTGRASPYNNPHITVSGFNLTYSSYNNDDAYLKTKVEFSDKGYIVKYDPYIRRVITTSIQTGDEQINYSTTLKDIETPLTVFRTIINRILSDYHNEILTNDSSYTVYGYTVNITFVERLGVNLQGNLLDYVFTYVVSGRVLDPTFEEDKNQELLYITIPKQTGSTYIKRVSIYKFESSWISVDVDYNGTLIDQSSIVLMNGFRFRFSKGMYKVVTTDNFDRVTTYFCQYALSDTNPGGTVTYSTDVSTYENDGFTYTADSFTFTYDNSLYSLYIRYIEEGKDVNQAIEIFNGDNNDLTTNSIIELLESYNIEIAIHKDVTTLTFNVDASTYSRFIIKTVFANLETNYVWDSEKTNNDIVAYTHNVALYTYIPNVIVKNLSGSILDTSSQLSLTEDFTINISWHGIDTNYKYNFDNQIFIERTYVIDGTSYKESYYVSTGYTITEAGTYVAHVVNDIGYRSPDIHFSRSRGEILLYAVYTVSSDSDEETKLIESNLTNTYEDTDKINYNFYTLNTYLNFKSKDGSYVINQSLNNYAFDVFINNPIMVEELDFSPNEDARYFVDVRTNSNMGIHAKIVNIGNYSVDYDQDIPFVVYKIYTISEDGITEFIYRYITIYFLDSTATNISSVEIYKMNNDLVEPRPMYDNSSSTNTIRDTSQGLVLYFSSFYQLPGNRTFVDYYLNGELIQTLTSSDPNDEGELIITITDVGIHRFVVRDLAGHTHAFFSSYTTLYIYLINNIIYQVNEEEPINYQIFNGEVKMTISDTVVGIGQIYDATNIGISVIKNGAVYEHKYEDKSLTFTEPGHYSVTLDILTSVSNDSYKEIDRVISTTYNFTIINPNVAQRSFSIPTSYGFIVEKLVKDNLDYTDSLTTFDSLWLSNGTTGSGIYDVTIKTYLTSLRAYKSFTFRVWISEETPSIIGSIKYGETTTSKITVFYNPGLIYTQIGDSYIALNNEKIIDIDATSINEVLPLELVENMTYYVQIFSADGQLISSYKFTKKEPLNSTAYLVIAIVVIFVVIVVILFILLRRKAKIR